MFDAKQEVREYCYEKEIIHDIDDFRFDPYMYKSLNLRVQTNEQSMGGNFFVYQKLLIAANAYLNETGDDEIELSFDDFVDFFDKEIKFFDGCIIKKHDYSITNGKSARAFQKDTMTITDFCREMWNFGARLDELFWRRREPDSNGNRVYVWTKAPEALEKLRKRLRG